MLVFQGLSYPCAAQDCAPFCPNLNIPQYRETLTEDKQTELDNRASRLFRRAIKNQLYGSSEFGWEVAAWHDAFGLLLDDPALRIDKRPYDYLDVDSEGQKSVKRRIPDATMGLTPYDDFDLKREYTCEIKGCKIDHSHHQADNRLSRDRLGSMMHDPDCGLVVDGTWGKTDLLFPFAVYEAKKSGVIRSYEAAEEQIDHACRTYLSMLDDLVRDPDNTASYQTKDSHRYQLFAFVSCGSYWEIRIIWNFLDSCAVDTLWLGDVKQFSRAYDLICIVDQIHQWAVTKHRSFVAKHLEAWHNRHEKQQQAKLHDFLHAPELSRGSAREDRNSSDCDESEENSELNANGMERARVESLLSRLMNRAPWLVLKEGSIADRQTKAQRTRDQNRERRMAAQAKKVETRLQTRAGARQHSQRAKVTPRKTRRNTGPVVPRRRTSSRRSDRGTESQ